MTSRLEYSRVAPEAHRAVMGLEHYVRDCGLEHSLLELVKIRASQINGCGYCLDMHTKDARAAGEREQRATRPPNFDRALIGYAVATVFVVAALTYRYTLWIGRPPTRLYFRAGWREFLSWKNFRRYTLLIPRAWWTDIFGQTFLFRRSPTRWIMHQAIFWGVVISLLVTVPLTFVRLLPLIGSGSHCPLRSTSFDSEATP